MNLLNILPETLKAKHFSLLLMVLLLLWLTVFCIIEIRKAYNLSHTDDSIRKNYFKKKTKKLKEIPEDNWGLFTERPYVSDKL